MIQSKPVRHSPSRHAARIVMAGLLGASLAACARQGPPAPVVNGDNGYGAYGGSVLRETRGGSVIVKHGQTLYAVARAQNVPVRSLIDANHLSPPYHIHAGERLIVPHIREHVVQPGETLYAVSRRYGVEATTLAQLNHLQPPYNIRVGMPLVLPPSVSEPSVAVASAASYAAPSSSSVAVAALPPLPVANVGTKPLKPPPAIADMPEPLVPPPVPEQALTAPPPAPPPVAVAKASQAPAEPEEQSSGATPPPTPTVAVTVASIVANHRAPSSPIFYWPVRGRIISVFGPASGGMHNDGVNIVAPEGTTVSAAENGVVAYAGNELKGFGNLLLIKHSGGWITAYAHNKVLLVKKGDHVRRGQPIAQIGGTGGVSQPQLHFELRQGAKAIDPLDHLPALSGAG